MFHAWAFVYAIGWYFSCPDLQPVGPSLVVPPGPCPSSLQARGLGSPLGPGFALVLELYLCPLHLGSSKSCAGRLLLGQVCSVGLLLCGCFPCCSFHAVCWLQIDRSCFQFLSCSSQSGLLGLLLVYFGVPFSAESLLCGASCWASASFLLLSGSCPRCFWSAFWCCFGTPSCLLSALAVALFFWSFPGLLGCGALLFGPSFLLL